MNGRTDARMLIRTDRYKDARRIAEGNDAFGFFMLAAMLDGIASGNLIDRSESETPLQDVLEWEPSTLRHEMDRVLGGRMSSVSFDRLMAAVAVFSTDLFTASARHFFALANSLADQSPLESADPPSVEECAWAVVEAGLLDEEMTPKSYSPEIGAALAIMLRNDGFLYPPPSLAPLVAGHFQAGSSEWETDPMFGLAVNQAQADRTAAIAGMVERNMKELREQLRTLPHADRAAIGGKDG